MHIRKFYSGTILSQPASATALAALPSVRCVRLASILEAHSVQHVNFFVLDVEGAELAGVLLDVCVSVSVCHVCVCVSS